jgi:WD40 repeat protein
MAAALVLALVTGTVVSILFAADARQQAEDARRSERNVISAREAVSQLAIQATEEAKRANASKAEAERSLYFNRIALAQQYWRADNVVQADRLLNQCPVEMRGWEWRYLNRMCHTELFSLPGNGQYTTSMHFSRDGKRMAAISIYGDSGARIWDMTADPPTVVTEVKSNFRPPYAIVTAGTLSPDGKLLALGASSGIVALWDATTGLRLRDVGRLAEQVNRLSFHRDGIRLAATGGKEMKIWDVHAGREELSRKGVTTAAFLESSDHLLIVKPAAALFGPDEVSIQLCDATSGAEIRDLGRYANLSWSATATDLALRHRRGGNESALSVVEIASGKEKLTTSVAGGWGDVAIRPDGRLIACCDKFGASIQIWDVVERQLMRTLHGHLGSVVAVEFAPDGRLASCAWDNTVRIWDPTIDQEFTNLPGKAAMVVSHAAFHPNASRVAIVQGDNVGSAVPYLFGNPSTAVNVWDPVAGKATQTLKGHTEGARRVAYSADGQRLASGGRDGLINVWDCESGKPISKWKAYDGWVISVALSPDGSRLASTHESKEMTEARMGRRDFTKVPEKARTGEVKVWNAATGQLLFTISGFRSNVQYTAFSPDGRLIASAIYDEIRLSDATTGKEIGRLQASDASGGGLAFSPDGRNLFGATSMNNTINVWDVAERRVRFSLVGHSGGRFAGAAFSPDGLRIATGMGHDVKLWDAATGAEILSLPLPPAGKDRVPGVDAITFSPDGQRLFALLNDGTNIAWEAPPKK